MTEISSAEFVIWLTPMVDIYSVKNFGIQKERRVSLEVLVVPFERPCWPQKFVCASVGLLLKRPDPNYLFLAAFFVPFFADFLAPPFFAAFFPPFLVAILSCSFFSRF